MYCFWVSDRWHEVSFFLVLGLVPENICRFPQNDFHPINYKVDLWDRMVNENYNYYISISVEIDLLGRFNLKSEERAISGNLSSH